MQRCNSCNGGGYINSKKRAKCYIAKKNRIQATFKKSDEQRKWDTIFRNAKPYLVAYEDFYEKKINKYYLN